MEKPTPSVVAAAGAVRSTTATIGHIAAVTAAAAARAHSTKGAHNFVAVSKNQACAHELLVDDVVTLAEKVTRAHVSELEELQHRLGVFHSRLHEDPAQKRPIIIWRSHFARKAVAGRVATLVALSSRVRRAAATL